MRLISYNILNGGEGRADPLAEVLLAQRPDVVVLIEADVPAVVDRIARRLNMQPTIGSGAKHSVAILTRLPVLESIDHSAIDDSLERGMLEVVVDIDGSELPIIALHLPAHATREAEAIRLNCWQNVCARLSAHQKANRPHLLCGDFNANASSQIIDPAKCKQATRKGWETNGQMLPRDLIAAVESAGYTDSLRAVAGESANSLGSFDTQATGQRVDYIFTFGFPKSTLLDAWIEQDRLAKYASDHYPVGIEWNLGSEASGV